MKILITGIHGMLGTELSGLLEKNHEVHGIDIDSRPSGHKVNITDLNDSKATFDTITRINPDIVIHTAAATNVDLCETNPDMAYKMNSLATRNVALACQKYDAVMLYISTDYVFSGKKKTSYCEFDQTDPVSIYGRSKLEGEVFVKNLLNKYYIVRTSWLFGHLRGNFVTQIADAVKTNKAVKTATDMVSSPTNVKDLSLGIEELIESNLYGTYHITNSRYASRYEIGLAIAKMMKKSSKNIEKLSLKSLKLPADRPKFSAMRNYMRELNGFKPIRSWQDAVAEFLNEKEYI